MGTQGPRFHAQFTETAGSANRMTVGLGLRGEQDPTGTDGEPSTT